MSFCVFVINYYILNVTAQKEDPVKVNEYFHPVRINKACLPTNGVKVYELPTLFYVQDLAGVNLHLRLAVSFVLAQPAVTGEHVMLPTDWNHDLNAVQEPAGAHAFVVVADHQTVDL